MPGRFVPQQQDGRIEVGVQHLLEVLGGRLCVHGICAQSDLGACAQVERAEKVGAFSTRMYLNHGCLAFGRPHSLGGGLQVEARLILRYDDCLRCFLNNVDQFFSISASKSATATSARER